MRDRTVRAGSIPSGHLSEFEIVAVKIRFGVSHPLHYANVLMLVVLQPEGFDEFIGGEIESSH